VKVTTVLSNRRRVLGASPADGMRHGLGQLRRHRPVAPTSEETLLPLPNLGGWGGVDTTAPTFTTQPIDAVGAQLFPCSLATGTPQFFSMARLTRSRPPESHLVRPSGGQRGGQKTPELAAIASP
jgi:hypothetical protein